LLFAGHLAGMSLFYHTHVVQGERIVHSHFYSGGATGGTTSGSSGGAQNPGHGHSAPQLVQISLLSISLMAASSTQAGTIFFARVRGGFVRRNERSGTHSEPCQNPLRAPPVAA
jgi:hypothetical protein